MSIKTFQTKLADADNFLDDWLELTSAAEREVIGLLRNQGSTNGLCKQYQMSGIQIKDIKCDLNAKIKSRRECLSNEIEDKESRSKGIDEKLKELSDQISRIKEMQSLNPACAIRHAHHRDNTCSRLKSAIHNLQRKKQKFLHRIELAKQELNNPNLPIKIHSPSIFIQGAVQYETGNALIQYDAENELLLFQVPEALKPKYGELVVFAGINFNHGETYLAYATAKPVDGRRLKAKNARTKSTEPQYTVDKANLPVTYRIQRNTNKSGESAFYIYASVDSGDIPYRSRWNNGIIGLDLNEQSVDWSYIDFEGNLRAHGSIPMVVRDKSSSQTKDIIRKIAVKIGKIADKWDCPVAIEDLDFIDAKLEWASSGVKYRRMLSGFAYRTFAESLESRLAFIGIQLKKVNPAYTSRIGLEKYAAMYGLNSGCAAAIVIARRACITIVDEKVSFKFSERPPQALKTDIDPQLNKQKEKSAKKAKQKAKSALIAVEKASAKKRMEKIRAAIADLLVVIEAEASFKLLPASYAFYHSSDGCKHVWSYWRRVAQARVKSKFSRHQYYLESRKNAPGNPKTNQVQQLS